MKITIKGKEYNFDVRSWWGPLYKFEDIMDVAQHPERKFNPALTFHMHVMFYAVLLCDNESLDITIEDFLESLNDLALCNSMREHYAKRVEILTRGQRTDAEDKQESKKKH